MLGQQVQRALDLPNGDQRVVEGSRMVFYLAHGIVSTYIDSPESSDALMARLETANSTICNFAGLTGYFFHTIHPAA